MLTVPLGTYRRLCSASPDSIPQIEISDRGAEIEDRDVDLALARLKQISAPDALSVARELEYYQKYGRHI